MLGKKKPYGKYPSTQGGERGESKKCSWRAWRRRCVCIGTSMKRKKRCRCLRCYQRRWIVFAVELSECCRGFNHWPVSNRLKWWRLNRCWVVGPSQLKACQRSAGSSNPNQFRFNNFRIKFAKASPPFSAASRMTLIILTCERFFRAKT